MHSPATTIARLATSTATRTRASTSLKARSPRGSAIRPCAAQPARIFSPRGVPHSFEIHSDEIHSDRVRMPILLTAAGLEGYFKQFCTPALILPPPAEVQYADVTKPNSVVAFISNAHDSTQAKNGLELVYPSICVEAPW